MAKVTVGQIKDIVPLRQLAIETYNDTFVQFNTAENMATFFAETYSIEAFEKEFNEPNSIYYLAWEENEMVGFLRLRVSEEENLNLRNAIELQRLYVKTQFQGKHIGRLLMNKALLHARKAKYDWIWLGVWESNFNAQRFYERWGFERFSEHIFYMGDDPQIDWLMKLKL